jgi:two-component system, NarL family, response regulator NreC
MTNLQERTVQMRVLLVEDHDIVRQGIRSLIESESGIEIAGEARNGEEAVEKVKATDPDVIIMDMNMPVMSGLECTRKIKREFPGKKVLILSMHDHENYLIDMLDAGADGYILKNSNKDELLFAIRKVFNNGIYMGPEFTMSMLAKYKAAAGFINATKKTEIRISDREMDVLQRIAQGKTNSQIAGELFTSIRTIETRRKNLLEKTGTTNTATLIRFAVLNGLVK